MFALSLLFAAQPLLEDLNALDARLAVASENRAVPLDRRLRLAHCIEPARIDPDPIGGLVVYCPSSGWRLRVAMKAGGDAASPPSPIMIQRGESVQLTIGGGGFSVQGQAIAVEQGRKGDPVRVKLTSSGKVLVATVAGYGRVEIVE